MMSAEHTGPRPSRLAAAPAVVLPVVPDGASTRHRNQLERRRRIVIAALQLAADGGYDAVQMRDVAKRARVALGTIYRYFASKDEMLIAGLAVWARDVAERVVAERVVAEGSTGGSPAERLASALREVTDLLDQHPVLMRALVTAMASTDPAIDDSRVEVEAALASIVSATIGDVPDVDLDGVRAVIGHVWFSVLVRWVSGRGETGSMGEELARTAHLLLDR
jgi:AcrR family transcriptional regulator